jgi:hypothetical protein
VEDAGPDPPILSYQSALLGAKTHRAAGIVMLIWGFLTAIAGLLATFSTIVSLIFLLEQFLLPYRSSPTQILILVFLFLTAIAIASVRTAIGSIRLAVRFFHHQPVYVPLVIKTVTIFETLTYMAGGVMILFLFCFVGWYILIVSAPLFALGAGLTFTRHVLLRVRYPQLDHPQASDESPPGGSDSCPK